MNKRTEPKMTPMHKGPRLAVWTVAILSVLVIFLALRSQRRAVDVVRENLTTNHQRSASTVETTARANPFARNYQRMERLANELPPEQIVSNKLSQFARNRRAVMEAFAKKKGVEVTADVKRFFDALEANDWVQADAMFQGWMKERRERNESNSELPPSFPWQLWTGIRDAYGVAETAHDWPAQKLLDYGESVLGSLRPGMVYVGGTDAGRFIPTLLNETSEGERHVVLTQNAFADGSYLEYAEFLYGDQLKALTKDDSQKAFQEYMTAAQARMKSGELRPGEDVKVVENRVQVSGQVAVMAINEALLNRLMEKNPELNFALEESFSLKSTYDGAVPLGPILELRASKEPPSQPQIAAAVDQWRGMAQNISGDAPNSDVRKTYSHMAQAQGNYFADRGFPAEAEQTWQVAREMCPGNPEAVNSLYNLWKNSGRAPQAETMLNQFERDYPDQAKSAQQIRKDGVLFRTP
jgi:tetratricopeptide (TPR) repeat protein